MNDPLGLINSGGAGGVDPLRALGPGARSAKNAASTDGPSFQETLLKELGAVNELQQQATQAVEDLAAGRRSDVETVIMATQQADTAFRMLLSVRNRVMEAYQEVQQMRV
ncbi:MAG: flagellar hook-basal body complex protein FliE [Planctomycetota bacterium]